MDNENESRPLLHSFQSETWRSRARKRCMRIPSEITITGIILGLFLIVVTLLIVLENMESDKKEKNISLNANLLASPMKYNKKIDDQLWQDKKDYMQFKNRQMEEKSRKLDKINKGWKQLPDISASMMKLNNKADNQLYQDKTDYMKFKERKMEEKIRKWDKVNKGWKKLPDISGNIHDHENEEMQKNLKDDVGVMGIGDSLDEYGKEIDDSLEAFVNLRMSEPSEMQKFREEALEAKNLLHSNVNWKIIDDGWKALSAQGWKEKDIRRALSMAINEKRIEIRNAELQNILQSPMKIDDIWNQISDSWKKNIQGNKDDVEYKKNKGTDEADGHLSINDEWRKKGMNILQSPKSDMKNFVREDEGYQRLANKGWKNKDIEESLVKAWKDQGNTMQSPINTQDLWGKASDFLKNILNKGMNNPKSQMKTNDEWADKFSNILQSSYTSWKNNNNEKDKHSKDVSEDKNTDSTDDEPQEFQMNFDDFLSIIDLMKEHEKGMDNQKSQLEKNNEFADTFVNLLQSSFKKMKKYEELKKKHSKDEMKYKELDENEIENNQTQGSPINFEEFVEIIKTIKDLQKERSSTSNPEVTLLRNSMPFVQNKISKGQKNLPHQGTNGEVIKEAIYKAWKDSENLRKSAVGQNNMKWKKVNDGWKTISNKSAIVSSRCPIPKFQRQLIFDASMSSPPIDCALIAEKVKRDFGTCIDLSFLPRECKPNWRENCFTTHKYRKMDGTCNNKIHPTWGKSATPFIRMMEPDYADGVSSLRASKDGAPLPNSRFLSSKLYSNRTKPNSDTSVLFMYFGLLIDHDMIETALNSGDLPCCVEDFGIYTEGRPLECLQIDIPADDPFYGPKNVPCLNLVRSAPVNGECIGRREQLNKATAFLDGSVVYGSSVSQAKQLRTFSKGQLRTQLINNTPFMAYADGVGPICGTPGEPLKCFEAGDSRVNMMVELTAMHTLWYREHNRIANELHKLNPTLTDEVLYQEARRILIAEFQHIAYNEFLPLLLGEKAAYEYELKIDRSKIYEGYDETVNPSVFNVFGAAAFRFGHSLVPDKQDLRGPENSTEGEVPLHKTFFNVEILYHDGLDLLLRGAATQRTQTVDNYVSPEVREHLFQPSDLDYGYDLAAVGIQRGRDHGLPGYTRWRHVCGLSEIKDWDDLYDIMDTNKADIFKDAYKSVEDIDLIPGALAEYHEEDSLVGPTYTCLIGRQFKKIRKGDRFWFENQNEIGSLTKDQLDEIYKSSMARIVCDNSDSFTEIQENPFKIPSNPNIFIDCDTIPKLNLSLWSSTI